MGLRFRRSIKLAPGIKINIGKTGVSSITAGIRGANATIGKKGTSINVGIPGTGLSYRETLYKNNGTPCTKAMENSQYETYTYECKTTKNQDTSNKYLRFSEFVFLMLSLLLCIPINIFLDKHMWLIFSLPISILLGLIISGLICCTFYWIISKNP